MATGKKVGLFGGTFDPIHSAHLIVAREAADQAALDEVAGHRVQTAAEISRQEADAIGVLLSSGEHGAAADVAVAADVLGAAVDDDVDTQIDRHLNSFMQFGLKVLAATGGKTIEEGAATTCYVATSAALDSTSGEYFEDCNAVVVHGDNHLYDQPMAARLMQVSHELTADYLLAPKVSTKEDLVEKR